MITSSISELRKNYAKYNKIHRRVGMFRQIARSGNCLPSADETSLWHAHISMRDFEKDSIKILHHAKTQIFYTTLDIVMIVDNYQLMSHKSKDIPKHKTSFG